MLISKIKKIYFLILNFNTCDETKACVKSIEMLEADDYVKHIIIIDNCSSDGSFHKLNEYYNNRDDIDIYEMGCNLGFSKANNFGYKLIKNAGDADLCVVCNSDIIFIQQDFLIRLEQEYFQLPFYICGPDVYCESRKESYHKGHQSPMYPFEWNRKYVETYAKYHEYRYKKLKGEEYSNMWAYFIRVKWFYWQCLKNFSTKTYYARYRRKHHKNVPIHGSCIIVSKLFLEKEDSLFLPEIMFYGEELLLFLRCKRKRYMTVFDPDLLVYHLQGRATSSLKNSKEKDLFRFENYVIGAKTYLEESRK